MNARTFSLGKRRELYSARISTGGPASRPNGTSFPSAISDCTSNPGKRAAPAPSSVASRTICSEETLRSAARPRGRKTDKLVERRAVMSRRSRDHVDPARRVGTHSTESVWRDSNVPNSTPLVDITGQSDDTRPAIPSSPASTRSTWLRTDGIVFVAIHRTGGLRHLWLGHRRSGRHLWVGASGRLLPCCLRIRKARDRGQCRSYQ